MDNPDTYNSPGLWAGGAAIIGGFAAWTATAHIIDRLPLLSVLRAAEGLNPLAFGVTPAIAGVAGAAAAGWMGWHGVHADAERHVRGPKLHKLDHRKAAMALKPKRKLFRKARPGVFIHPQICISKEQECRHIMLLGGSGSGKTSILWPVINQAVARDDKCLIFSFKGDFQQKAAFPFSLLAPWDSRSVHWQLGKDIDTRLKAESLARTLCPDPEKGEKIWAQGAQGLLTAIISSVQRDHKDGRWGFSQLAKACSIALSDYDSLVKTVMQESPLAKAFLMGKDSKTTASYLAQIASGLSDVINLGVADTSTTGKSWSVTDWLAGRTPAAAILGYLPAVAGLSKAYCSTIIEQIVTQILSFDDCDPDERRIWIFLDEVPQAGKVPSITDALEASRSKGCRVVLGMQGVAQLEEHGYSKNTLRIWGGQCGLKIISNLSDPDDQKWASNLLGERDILRYQRTITNSNTSGSNSGVYQPVKEHLMLPGEFGGELRVVPEAGPRALLMSPGANAILQWPFPKLEAFRDARIDADWTLPDYKRPVWGAVPPRTGTPTQGSESESAAASVVDQATQTTQIIEQQQDAPAPAAPVADAGLTDLAADHVVSTGLDAALPGAGALFELMSMNEPGQSVPAPVTRQQSQQHEEEDEKEAGS
ncbi:type IV secretory system conjugative DNA transfer family protein [Acidithiobacillus ferrivorans]|nr:type IV secretion system DNA-binding domain-containing protein [Acidithiobacillus ferrivorans]